MKPSKVNYLSPIKAGTVRPLIAIPHNHSVELSLFCAELFKKGVAFLLLLFFLDKQKKSKLAQDR